VNPSKPLTPASAQRKRGQPLSAARPSDGSDLLQVLVFCKLLAPEALASYAGLRFVKINPLDLDLDVVTTSAERRLDSSWLSVDLGNQEFLSAEAEELDPAAAPVVTALDHILSYAFEQRESDMHFEPKRSATPVRLRIDGVLHENGGNDGILGPRVRQI
jgi:type II secretory ATPase GspE/PulE/Tfp pilus assembly ATPase PilB-like protein